MRSGIMLGPRSSPACPSSRAVADVPERCMPVMTSGGTGTALILPGRLGSHPVPHVEFALVAEAGPLEAQARLLVDSLRRFGGRHANAAVTVVSPRRSRRPSQATLRALRRAGARYVALDLASACPDYPTSWRVHALAHVERQPGPDVLVQLDSDALFLGDVGELCADARAAGRPIDVKGMATTGPGDGYEPYWAALCGLASVDLEALPFVRTTVDDI